jgi:hypothetical protein
MGHQRFNSDWGFQTGEYFNTFLDGKDKNSIKFVMKIIIWLSLRKHNTCSSLIDVFLSLYIFFVFVNLEN